MEDRIEDLESANEELQSKADNLEAQSDEVCLCLRVAALLINRPDFLLFGAIKLQHLFIFHILFQILKEVHIEIDSSKKF